MLSKSEYLMFLKHPAWLWLKKHDKEKLPPVDAALQAIFDAGTDFEQYAEALFPGGKKVGFNNYSEYLEMPKKTAELVNSGVSAIFQGRFETAELTCIIDVMKKNEDGTYDLYEIKSSSQVKEDHLIELSFQTIVLEDVGIKIRNIHVLHVNKDYVRLGDIVPKDLVALSENLNKEVRDLIPETQEKIQKALKVVRSKTIPDISPRHAATYAFKEWLDIYKILSGEKDKYSIYSLARLNASFVGKFEDDGILHIKDIPDEYKLHPAQIAQIMGVRSKDPIINKEKIDEFLKDLVYPLYFFDYETISAVVPLFDGTRPNQQIPFQYSLHIKETPDGDVVHKEFLPQKYGNPMPELLKSLRNDIGNIGSVIVWNKKFECDRNKEMAEMYPEYADFLNSINDRIVDLMIPFWNNWYIHKDFCGSASLKAVLPVLIPELSYKELNISSGATVGDTWKRITSETVSEKERKSITNDLLKYCELDTFSMVKILELLEGRPTSAKKGATKGAGQGVLF